MAAKDYNPWNDRSQTTSPISMTAVEEWNWHNAMAAQEKLVEEQQYLTKLDTNLNMLTSSPMSAFIFHWTLDANPGSLISPSDKYARETSLCKGFLQQFSQYSLSQEGVSDHQKNFSLHQLVYR